MGYNCCIVAKWPKKESAYPKREMDTHRLQKLDIDYTVYIKDYKSQTCTLQSLLIDYKNQIICLGHPSEKFIVFTFCITKACSVCFFNTKFVVCAFLLQSLYCVLFETTKVCSALQSPRPWCHVWNQFQKESKIKNSVSCAL